MSRLDFVHGVLAALGLVFLVLFAVERVRRLSARKSVARLEAELKEARKAGRTSQYRLERFDLLWFPTVVATEDNARVESVAPGLPHCKACVLPLRSRGDQWVCPQCESKHPDSLADLMATESIRKEAVKLFEERRSRRA